MAYHSFSIANAFLDLAKEHGGEITPMKMQKLVYIAHGWRLAISDEKLISDRIEAWEYGPVIPPLYGVFKKYGRQSIKEHAKIVVNDVDIVAPPPRDESVRSLLNTIWLTYGRLDGLQLSSITHKEDTPWEKTWGKGILKHQVIPEKSIKEYYQRLAA